MTLATCVHIAKKTTTKMIVVFERVDKSRCCHEKHLINTEIVVYQDIRGMIDHETRSVFNDPIFSDPIYHHYTGLQELKQFAHVCKTDNIRFIGLKFTPLRK